MRNKKFYIDCKDFEISCNFRAESKGQRELVSIMEKHLKEVHQKEITKELTELIIKSIKTPPIEMPH